MGIRKHKAYAIFCRWPDGKTEPVYEFVRGDWPWFLTKKCAQDFLRRQKECGVFASEKSLGGKIVVLPVR